jgi:hypothetical protein
LQPQLKQRRVGFSIAAKNSKDKVFLFLSFQNKYSNLCALGVIGSAFFHKASLYEFSRKSLVTAQGYSGKTLLN